MHLFEENSSVIQTFKWTICNKFTIITVTWSSCGVARGGSFNLMIRALATTHDPTF